MGAQLGWAETSGEILNFSSREKVVATRSNSQLRVPSKRQRGRLDFGLASRRDCVPTASPQQGRLL